MKRPAKRTPQAKEATREALVAAGMALFAKHGLDGPSLDDICAHAGFTRGAFYVHFKDRDEFLVAVMDDVGRKLMDELLASGHGGLGETIRRFVAASESGRYPLMPAGGIRPHQLLQACARSSAVRHRYLGLVRRSRMRVRDLVAEGQAAGLVRADLDPARTSTLLMAMVGGLQTLAELGVDINLAELGTELLALIGPPVRPSR